MKNFTKSIAYGLLQTADKNITEVLPSFYDRLFKNLTIQVRTGYWQELTTFCEPDEHTVFMPLHLMAGKLDKTVGLEEDATALLQSLPFIYENLNAYRRQAREVLYYHCTNSRFCKQTFLSMLLFHEFIYYVTAFKNRETAFEKLRQQFAASMQNDPDFEFLFNPDFLTVPEIIPENESVVTAVKFALYRLMTTDTFEAANRPISSEQQLPLVEAVTAVLAAIYHYAVAGTLEDVSPLPAAATDFIKATAEKYPAEFDFPVFEDPLKKYSMQQLYLFDTLTGLKQWNDDYDLAENETKTYLKDHDDAHDSDCSMLLTLAETAYGLKYGYISEKAHLLDIHRYNFNPDFMEYAEDLLSSGENAIGDCSISALKQRYCLEKLFPYI